MRHDPLARLKDSSLVKSRTLVGGECSASTECFAVVDPATGEHLCDVSSTSEAQTRHAIDVAAEAFPHWRNKTAKQRSAVLRRWYELLIANADDLARIMTAEQGKPYAEARAEVLYGASFVEWYAEEAKRAYGETLPEFDRDRRLMVMKRPIGVCAAITPWNFPLAMITRKVAPALAAGCTVILKPAEQTPLTALACAELAIRADFPPGVFNVLPADARRSVEVGKILCDSKTVRHLSFTGSTEVGRILMAQSAPSVKKLGLELGGNAPFIVFDDADLDSAVEGAMASKFRNCGQTCVCANRIYVQDAVYDRFVEKFTESTRALKVGNGFEPGVTIGPLIDESAVEKVQRHVSDAVSAGARITTGGRLLEGRFFEPTVIADAADHMLCCAEETFGPIAPIIRFAREPDVIAAANDTDYGLACYVYSRDMARVFRMLDALEYGVVGVNAGVVATEHAPFGGVKASGLGREGSRHGLDEYLELQYACLAGIQT